MSRARHKRESGGRTDMWVSGNPDVKKEAEKKGEGGSRKKGGKVVGRMAGGQVTQRSDRPARKQGGALASHRPGRKRGGGVGANTSPLSTAHKGTANDGAGSSSPADTYGGNPSD